MSNKSKVSGISSRGTTFNKTRQLNVELPSPTLPERITRCTPTPTSTIADRYDNMSSKGLIVCPLFGGIYKIKQSIKKSKDKRTYCGENIYTKENVIIQLQSTKMRYPSLPFSYKINRKLLQNNTCTQRYDGFGNIKNITDIRVICTVFGYIRQQSVQYVPQELCYIILHYLHRSGLGNIPIMQWYGKENGYHAVVMEELGPSLEDLFNLCSRKFSLKTILMIADEMLSIIQFIHESSFIHRYLHPCHFMIGKDKWNKNNMYLIGYRLSKRYCNPKTLKHIPFKENKTFTGTPRYGSINAHLGYEQSRRDDMETIGYILAYFYLGRLPWSGLKKSGSTNMTWKVGRRKMNVFNKLCKGIPDEFAAYLKYCRKLDFYEKPDYGYLRGLFRDLFHRKGFHLDYGYDWTFFEL